jgi:hypothetical protein
MEAFGELPRHADKRGVAGAKRVADLNEARGGLLGDAERQPRWPAHQQVGGMAVDQDGGQDGRLPVVDKTEIVAHQFDFSVRQSSGGHNVVDARIGENLRDGLGVRMGHWLFRLDSVGGEK